jgi:uridine kinase
MPHSNQHRLAVADSNRAHKASLVFLVVAVFKKLYPDWEVLINHTISEGVYCTVTGGQVCATVLKNVTNTMNELIAMDLPFETVDRPSTEAVAHFERIGWTTTADHVRSLKQPSVTLTRVNEQMGLVMGPTVKSTGTLKHFQLLQYTEGFIIRYPRPGEGDKLPPFVEQPKLFAVFREADSWQSILGMRSVCDLNQQIQDKHRLREIIHVAESLHEKKFAAVADDIARNIDTIRAILIAGPSSSGKTTFCKRLAVHLKVNGIKTLPISLDNYFTDRAHTPRDEKGDYDFESIYALRLDILNDHLTTLLSGGVVELPKYDFTTGLSAPSGKKIQADNKTLLVLEGIHGLNDELTPAIWDIQKYRIYVSAFTPIGLDNTNRMPTTDLRLIRRIVRDNSYRNYSARETITRWPSVRHGEERWIFPHQNKANIMFNTTLLYEPAILKAFAQPLLEQIPENDPVFEDASRLRDYLRLFDVADPTAVPGTSIVREFIGGSHFKY